MLNLDLTQLKEENIVIYGAGVYGELAYRGLEYIGVKPRFFCDRYVAGQEYFGVQVIDFERLEADYKDYLILVASAPYFGEIRSLLEEHDFLRVCSIEKLIELPIKKELLSSKAQEKKDNLSLYLEAVIASNKKDELIFGHLEVVLTERCSLRCKDCANLMQYYKSPENLDIQEILDSIKILLKVVNRVSELRLLGGEPFVNRNLLHIFEEYGHHPKIGKIVIYTNGTIIPDDEVLEIIRKNDGEIHISNYDVKYSKIPQLVSKLEETGIKYFVRDYDSWNKLGNLSRRTRLGMEFKKMYTNCVMANCYTLYRGKIYKCPRSAHGERLGAFENCEDEYVDLLKNDITKKELLQQCKDLLQREKILTACFYCNGSNWHEEGIKAAIQVDHVCALEEE